MRLLMGSPPLRINLLYILFFILLPYWLPVFRVLFKTLLISGCRNLVEVFDPVLTVLEGINQYCKPSQVALVVKNLPPSAGNARRGFSSRVRKILWRSKWQPTLVFLPGKSHGQRSLAGYSTLGRRVRHDRSDFTQESSGNFWHYPDVEGINQYCKPLILKYKTIAYIMHTPPIT